VKYRLDGGFRNDNSTSEPASCGTRRPRRGRLRLRNRRSYDPRCEGA